MAENFLRQQEEETHRRRRLIHSVVLTPPKENAVPQQQQQEEVAAVTAAEQQQYLQVVSAEQEATQQEETIIIEQKQNEFPAPRYARTLLTIPRKATPETRETLLRMISSSNQPAHLFSSQVVSRKQTRKQTYDLYFTFYSIFEDFENIRLKKKALKPTSRLRVVWDSIIMSFIFYLLFMTPFDIAFEVSFYPWIIIDALMDICFIFDLYLNMHTAYVEDNDLILDFSLIRSHYLKTWFYVDFIASLPFGTITKVLQYSVPNSEIIPLLKLLKIVRIFRMYHLYKAIAGMEILKGPLMVGLIMLWFGIISHWFACIFWKIGTLEAPGRSWIDLQGNFPDLRILSQAEQYSVTMYWAMATMTTLGYGDITPKNLLEVVYATCVIFCGAILYAILLSVVSIIVVGRFSLETKYNQKMEGLQQFSSVYRLPKQVQHKIAAYYDFIWERRKDFSDSNLMDTLPFELKSEVATCIHSKMITQNRLLRECSQKFGFLHIFASYLSPIIMKLPDQVLYFEGEEIVQVIFIRRGTVDVVVGLDTMEELVVSTRTEGGYVGDIGLFESNEQCIHLESAVTITFSEVCSISTSDLCKIFELFPNEKTLFENVSRARKFAIEKLLLEFDEFAQFSERGGVSTETTTTTAPNKRSNQVIDVTETFWDRYDDAISPETDAKLIEEQLSFTDE